MWKWRCGGGRSCPWRGPATQPKPSRWPSFNKKLPYMYATVLEEMEWIWTMGKRLENCAGGEKMVWRTEKRNWQEKSKVKTSAGGSSRYMAGRSTHGRTRKCKESRRKEGRARSKGKEEGWPSTSVEGNLHIRHPMYSAKCADPLSRQAKQKARPESSTTASIQHPAGHLR